MVLLTLLLCSTLVIHAWNAVDVDIRINTKTCIHTASDKFLSIALDCGLISNKWKTFKPLDPGVVNMAKSLSPAYLRLGGTACDNMLFNTSDMTFDSSRNLESFPLTVTNWNYLVQLSRTANLTLLFDANVIHRDKNGKWNPDNFMKFLDYNQKLGVDNLIFELGNEPNNFPAHFNVTITAEQLAQDFATMRAILNANPLYKGKLLVGADIGNPYIRNGLGLDPATYIQDFLHYGHKYIDALTWHQYYMKGSTAEVKDFINVTLLDEYVEQVQIVKGIMYKELNSTIPVWMGETSSAYDSGAPNISNTYVAGFMWLDKLGVAAKYGYDVVIRQTFYDGWYALIGHDLKPYPDFWLSVLYKQLVGSRVLDIAQKTPTGTARIYCHCIKTSKTYSAGAVTLYAMNLSPFEALNISVSQFGSTFVDAYVLTPAGNLTSVGVQLNGVELAMQGSMLPDLTPEATDRMILKPLTFGFFVLKDVIVPACLS